MTNIITNIPIDIDIRINTIYDAFYNKNSTGNYGYIPIIKNSLNLDDLKMHDNYDITSVLDQNIEFIGKYNNRYYFKRKSDTSYPTTIVVSKYNDLSFNNINNNKELYNVLVHTILSEITFNERYLHTIIPIVNFDLDMKNLENKNKLIHFHRKCKDF